MSETVFESVVRTRLGIRRIRIHVTWTMSEFEVTKMGLSESAQLCCKEYSVSMVSTRRTQLKGDN